MSYRSLAALGISIALLSAQARAESDEIHPSKHGKKKGAPKSDADSDWADGEKADDRSEARSEARAEGRAEGRAEDEPASEDKEPKTKPTVVVAPEGAPEAETPTVANEQLPELGPAPDRPAIYGKRSDWNFDLYGYARLDAIEDSTQSFEDGIQPNLIQRAGTYRGDHRRTIMTARDSRLGLFVGPPQYRGIRSMAQIELDFYGLAPTDARRHDTIVFAPPRLRLAFLKVETPIIDIIAGQYYDLFGWNSYFYVGTVGYLGVPAEVYHRNPQLRLEKKLHIGRLELMFAGAAVRPGQRDSGLPDGEAGFKISYSGWSGAAMAGFGRPALAPISLGVSYLYRAFEVPAFRAEPGSQAVTTFGHGLAASAFIPIIPVKNLKDRSNALTFVGEATMGTGIADMYTFMDGGSRFPILPNPSMAQPAVIYPSNVDPGLVTFDRNFELKTIDWKAFVANLQYFFPVDGGRAWVEGTYSRIWSDNIKDVTPFASWGGVFTKMEYFDVNLGYDLTPSVALGVSFQSVMQTFADVSAPTPIYGAVPGTSLGGLSEADTGGVAAHARNNRAQLSLSLFF